MKKTIGIIFCGLLSLNAIGAEVTTKENEMFDVIALERKAEIAYEKKILGCDPININIKVVEYKGSKGEEEEINFDICSGKEFSFKTENKEELPHKLTESSLSDKISDLRSALKFQEYVGVLDYNKLSIKLDMQYSDEYSFILLSNEKRVGTYKINDSFNTIFQMKYNEDITLYENKKRAYILKITKK